MCFNFRHQKPWQKSTAITPNDNFQISSTSGYTCCCLHGLWLIMSLKSVVRISGVGNELKRNGFSVNLRLLLHAYGYNCSVHMSLETLPLSFRSVSVRFFKGCAGWICEAFIWVFLVCLWLALDVTGDTLLALRTLSSLGVDLYLPQQSSVDIGVKVQQASPTEAFGKNRRQIKDWHYNVVYSGYILDTFCK